MTTFNQQKIGDGKILQPRQFISGEFIEMPQPGYFSPAFMIHGVQIPEDKPDTEYTITIKQEWRVYAYIAYMMDDVWCGRPR